MDRAFSNFFRGIQKGLSIGFPSFKKKGRRDSFRLTGTIKVYSKKIQLPRLGSIRLKEETRVKGRILSATVVREADRWFVSLAVVKEKQEPKPVTGNPVGIDVGLACFTALSNGEEINAPKLLTQSLKRLKKLSRQHSRKVIGSKNREKSALALARLHRKNRNIRRDFLHKQTAMLANLSQ